VTLWEKEIGGPSAGKSGAAATESGDRKRKNQKPSNMLQLTIRQAAEVDFDAIWGIFHHVVQSGDTYAFSPETTRSQAHDIWMTPPATPYVVEIDGRIGGTYILKPNQPDLGSHIANAAYVVHPENRRQGVGEAMCRHSIETARHAGYRAIQFNLVVSSNTGAITLWEKLGFHRIGRIPEGFRHPTLGFIDAYIMYRSLEEVTGIDGNESVMRRRAADGLGVGDRLEITRVFREQDMVAFAEITRDYNPVHFDERFSGEKQFKGRICHGLLVGGLLTEIGGQIGWLATRMDFRFRKPVFFDDTISCRLTITAVDATGKATAEAVFTNQDGQDVIQASLSGFLPGPRGRKILETMLSEGDPTNRAGVPDVVSREPGRM